MADTSAIEWTDATVNFWWGCTKVGPGCDNCYAEAWNAFRGNKLWGRGAPRRRIEGATESLRRLNRGHDRFLAEHGRRRRVFMQSMSDLFDNEVDQEWRRLAIEEAEASTNLDIIFLTKRVPSVASMIPSGWHQQWPPHIGLMITVVNQEEADRDIPRLRRLKAEFGIPWVGLSIEPLLGPIDLAAWLGQIDWVIVGGESGRKARPMQASWLRAIRDQCAEADAPFFFKQWGDYYPTSDANGADMPHSGRKPVDRVLDRRIHDEFWRCAR